MWYGKQDEVSECRRDEAYDGQQDDRLDDS